MLGTSIAKKVLRRLESTVVKTTRGVPRLEVERFGSYAEYHEHLERTAELDAKRAAAERLLIPAGATGQFKVLGYCAVCERWSRFMVDFAHSFAVDGDRPVPNWRESLICPRCFLNSRMRACFQLFRDLLRPSHGASVYMTEQVTSLFARIKDLYPNTVGSEFLTDGTPPGALDAAGTRFEDLTRLTFDDGRFDFILSFEVLEHVPDYKAALRECARVLKPGGSLVVTAPFQDKPETSVRARVGPEGIEHLFPPEYHGDPLSSDGCLCFYYFGGDFLDALREAGFREASIAQSYSRDLGYLWRKSPVFIAKK
jgi:SAM-dependent methyltransferase